MSNTPIKSSKNSNTTSGESFNQPRLYYTSGYSQQTGFDNFNPQFSSNNNGQQTGFFNQYNNTQQYYRGNISSRGTNFFQNNFKNRKNYNNNQYYNQPYYYRNRFKKTYGRKYNPRYMGKKNEEALKKTSEKLKNEEVEHVKEMKTIEESSKKRLDDNEVQTKQVEGLEVKMKENGVLECVTDVFKGLFKRTEEMVTMLDSMQNRVSKLSRQVVDLRKIQHFALARRCEKEYFSKFFGDIFQKSLHQPFLTHFKLCYDLKIHIGVSSFSLSEETKPNDCFKEIKSVKIPESQRKLIRFLQDNGGSNVGSSSFTDESNLTKLIGYDAKCIKYDAVLYEKSDELSLEMLKIVGVGKISVSYIVPMKDNVFEGSLDYQQMNLLKKLCQLERQVAYVKNLKDLKKAYLFGIGNFTSLKMNKFFKNNQGLFPLLEKLNVDGKLFVGTFQFFASCVNNLEGFKRKDVKQALLKSRSRKKN